MPIPYDTKHIEGLASLLKAARELCKFFGLYWPSIRPKLGPGARVAGDSLYGACQAFEAFFSADLEP